MMDTKAIIDSGFFIAFIDERIHFKEQVLGRRLSIMNALSDSIEDKKIALKNEIEITKNKLLDSGFKDLTLSYIDSANSKSKNYIGGHLKRLAFWKRIIHQFFTEELVSLQFITKLYEKSKATHGLKFNESKFWNGLIKEENTPKTKNLKLLIESEAELLKLIEEDIESHKENFFWDIDTTKYLKYKKTNNPIKKLFKYTNLLFLISTFESHKIQFDILNQVDNKGKLTKKALSKIRFGERDYTIPQIAIAYHFLKEPINQANAQEILERHSNYKSAAKLLQNRINRPSDLTKLSENPTSDTKHFNNLLAAKRLILGKKNKKAENAIADVIKVFADKRRDQFK